MGLLHCGSPCFIMRYRGMEVIVAVIILLAMGLLVGFSLAWYTLKLRCLNYSGRAEGIVTNTENTQYKDPETKEKKLRRSITAEYVVNGIAYKARTSFEANELYEGSQVTILYDEVCPRRYVFEHEIADPQKAKKRWLVAPVFAAIFAVFALVFLIPPLLGFTERQKDIYISIFYSMWAVVCVVMGILEICRKYSEGKIKAARLISGILLLLILGAALIMLFIMSI